MVRGPVEDAVKAIARGEIVVVVDDEDRENEGDLIMAAELAGPQQLGFFVKYTSGLICVAVTAERADELNLPLMVGSNTESQRTAFTVTVDAVCGTSTGISARDRAATARVLADPGTRPADLARPGHLHVLRAREGGVLERPGHTEAAVDLARLAGLAPAGVLCEVVSPHGTGMASGSELRRFADEHGLVMITIADLIRYRRVSEPLAGSAVQARLATKWGDFACRAYEGAEGQPTHLALAMGDVSHGKEVLVAVHHECLTGDLLGSAGCDCGSHLQQALARIAAEGRGVLVYLRAAGAGAVTHITRASERGEAQERLELAEDRYYGMAASILVDLQVSSMRLLMNHPADYRAMESYGLTVTEQVTLGPASDGPDPDPGDRTSGLEAPDGPRFMPLALSVRTT